MAHPLRHLVAMSTVGLLFVGGVAAAATGTNPLSPMLGANEDAGPSLTTTTTTTIGATTTTTAASAGAAALATEVVCPDDVANHGEAVSEVAKKDDAVGAEHGAAVSAMAKSNCGKTDDEDRVAPESESTATEVVCPDDVANHGEAVSEVAKKDDTVGAEHGAAVSAMAKSNCGKTDSTDGDEEKEELDAPKSENKSAKKHGRHNGDGDDDAGNELGS